MKFILYFYLLFDHFSACVLRRQEFDEFAQCPSLHHHFVSLSINIGGLASSTSRHPSTGKIRCRSIDLCIVYPLLWLLWLTSDHDFLREIVVIYSLNFCFCYCCFSFATALVVFGFRFVGFRYYLYDSLAVLVPFFHKHYTNTPTKRTRNIFCMRSQ